ncbi:hypothetical protein J6590_015515 [Homalodisca vitripennis]|nr:hypothetical protein J6590_015515 [Homalodisca vitripennis]
MLIPSLAPVIKAVNLSSLHQKNVCIQKGQRVNIKLYGDNVNQCIGNSQLTKMTKAKVKAMMIVFFHTKRNHAHLLGTEGADSESKLLHYHPNYSMSVYRENRTICRKKSSSTRTCFSSQSFVNEDIFGQTQNSLHISSTRF